MHRDVRLYLLTSVVVGFVSNGVFSVLLNIYLLRLGYGPSFIGAVNAARQSAFIVLSFPAGLLSQRLESRRLIIIGLICFMLGFLLLPQAELIPEESRQVWLIATSMLTSFGGPLFWVNGNLFMMERVGDIERSHAFSLRQAFLPLAGFVGSLAGGFLPGRVAPLLNTTLDTAEPYRWTLISAAVLFLPALIFMLRTDHIPKTVKLTDETKTQERFPTAIFIPLALIMFLRTIGEAGIRSFFNVYMDAELAISTDTIGLVAAIALLLSVPVALMIPPLADRWGNDKAFLVSMLGMVASLLPVIFIPTWWAASLSYVAMLLFSTATKPTIYVYRMEIITAVWWGVMSGTGGTTHGIGQVVATLGGGSVIEAIGYQPYFGLTAVLTLLGVVGFAFFRRKIQLPGTSKVPGS